MARGRQVGAVVADLGLVARPRAIISPTVTRPPLTTSPCRPAGSGIVLIEAVGGAASAELGHVDETVPTTTVSTARRPGWREARLRVTGRDRLNQRRVISKSEPIACPHSPWRPSRGWSPLILDVSPAR